MGYNGDIIGQISDYVIEKKGSEVIRCSKITYYFFWG